MATADDGATWQDLSFGLADQIRPSSFYQENGRRYLGTSNGLYASTSLYPLQKWEQVSFDKKFINGIYPGKNGPYVLCHWNGIHQYNEVLRQWQPVHRNLEDLAVHFVIEDDHQNIWAGCDNALYMSVDQGKSWKKSLDHHFTRNVIFLPDAMVCINRLGIWRSTDRGTSWKRVRPDLEEAWTLKQTDDGLISIFRGQEFAGIRQPNQLYKSTDQGKTWNKMYDAMPPHLHGARDIVQVRNSLFLSTDSGVLLSKDQGKTWEIILDPPRKEGEYYNLIQADDSLIVIRLDGC